MARCGKAMPGLRCWIAGSSHQVIVPKYVPWCDSFQTPFLRKEVFIPVIAKKKKGTSSRMCPLPVVDPGLCAYLHRVPGTAQRWGITEIQVTECFNGHLVEERRREDIDAFGDFAVPGAKQLRSEQTPTLSLHSE